MICCGRVKMAEGKKRDKTKKGDTVFGNAMDEVEAAMKEMKLMKEEAKKAKKEGRTAAGKDGIHLVHTTKNSQYTVNIGKANNIQIGNRNTMIINKGAKQEKEKESSSSSEEEEEEGDEEECNQEKRPEEMTPEERKIYDTLKSTKRATLQDVEVALNNVGKDYRRFLRYLGLTDVDIDHLELDYKVDGVKEVLHQGLLKWTTSEHQTVGHLAQSLKKLGKEDAVEELCDKISAGSVNM